MANGASRSQNVAAWIQSIAIVLAGLWAAYEFIFKEQAKTLHINPSLKVTVLEPDGAAAGDYVPVEIEVVVGNASDTEATVIAAFVPMWAHKAAPDDTERDILLMQLTTDDGRNNLITEDVRWRQETDLVGYANAFANTRFEPEERRGEKLVLYVPADTYDMLEVKAEFYVVNHCRGFYPFQTCYDFIARFTWDKHESCNPHKDDVRKDDVQNGNVQKGVEIGDVQNGDVHTDDGDGSHWCFQFKRRRHDLRHLDDPPPGETGRVNLTLEERGWVNLPREEYASFGFVAFSTTQMTLLPNAPILKARAPADPGK